MKFKSIVDEAVMRGEKIKEDVLNEILKSKTIQELVSNKNFVKAVGRIIETTEEVKKVVQKQVKSIFQIMDVPTKAELKRIASKIGSLEKLIDKVGRRNISVKSLQKKSTKSKKSATKKVRSTNAKKIKSKAAKPKRRSTKKSEVKIAE